MITTGLLLNLPIKQLIKSMLLTALSRTTQAFATSFRSPHSFTSVRFTHHARAGFPTKGRGANTFLYCTPTMAKLTSNYDVRNGIKTAIEVDSAHDVHTASGQHRPPTTRPPLACDISDASFSDDHEPTAHQSVELCTQNGCELPAGRSLKTFNPPNTNVYHIIHYKRHGDRPGITRDTCSVPNLDVQFIRLVDVTHCQKVVKPRRRSNFPTSYATDTCISTPPKATNARRKVGNTCLTSTKSSRKRASSCKNVRSHAARCLVPSWCHRSMANM
ncbi:hypothetical protein CPB85DRAFT_662260 [Mucidula mucida]|nr:hypothetical protein CPB85DRAFT_662260 [Mucidula mucida]